MGLVDKLAFEARGAHGCSDSDYAFAMTTCCERVAVIDHELNDFYWDSETPSRSVRLLEEPPCPFCEASAWGFRQLAELDQVPEAWRWASTDARRSGSRRVRPLAEHVGELLSFCRRVAAPIPDFERTLVLDLHAPGVRQAGGWVAPSNALFTQAQFAARFDQLLATGYGWVNLSALGVFENALVVGVERPAVPTGVPIGLTSVNYSGPAFTPQGAPNWQLVLSVDDSGDGAAG